MLEILISKGADINAKNIIYLKRILLFKLRPFPQNQGFSIRRIKHHVIIIVHELNKYFDYIYNTINLD